MSSSTTKSGFQKDEEWNQAESSAKEAAAKVAEMAGHAASAVGEMAGQAMNEAGRKVDDLTAYAGVGIQEIGTRLGREAPHSGIVGNASQAVANRVIDSGEYIERAKLSGMTEDVARLIRRNPISAVLIAMGMGWLIGSKLRS